MPRAPERHPHPKSDNIRCDKCRFWHPDYIDKFRIYPDGKLIQEKQAAAHSVNGLISDNYMVVTKSMCFRLPVWQHADDNHYCAEFESK